MILPREHAVVTLDIIYWCLEKRTASGWVRQFILTQNFGLISWAASPLLIARAVVGELAGAKGPVRTEYTNLFLLPSILAELWIPCTGQKNFSRRTFLLHIALEFTHWWYHWFELQSYGWPVLVCIVSSTIFKLYMSFYGLSGHRSFKISITCHISIQCLPQTAFFAKCCRKKVRWLNMTNDKVCILFWGLQVQFFIFGK